MIVTGSGNGGGAGVVGGVKSVGKDNGGGNFGDVGVSVFFGERTHLSGTIPARAYSILLIRQD